MLRGHTEGSNNNSGEEEELVTMSVFPRAVAAAAPEEEEVDEEVNTSSSSDDSNDDERNDNANAPHEPLEHDSPAGQRHTTRRSIHTNQYYHNDDEDEDGDDVRQCRSPPQEVPLDALIHEVAELQATEDRLKSRTTTALSTTITDRKSDGTSTDVSSIHNARWEEAKARLRRQAATTVMPAQRRSAEWDESESDGETIRYDAALSPLSYDEYISEEDLVGETSGALKRRTKVVVHEVLPWYTEWAHSLYNWIRYLSIANARVPGVDLYEANNPRAYFQRKEYTL